MIKASRLREIGEWIVERSDYFQKYIQAASEDDITALRKTLTQRELPVLLGILPSADSGSHNQNSRTDVNFIFFYAFVTEEEFKGHEDDKWDLTGECVDEIENMIANDADEPTFIEFAQIDWNSVHKDPEHEWGLKGYSISFQMKN